jgi:UDP-N-acetylmuramate: L-alanyl-gamma-D-glutamyl-meso-diaminopimelate ligase
LCITALAPRCSNNLEFDHADIFPDLAAIERQFHHLVRTVPASGRLVVNAEQDSLQRVLDLGQLERGGGFGAARIAALADARRALRTLRSCTTAR